jgi:hypothetical protein
LILLSIPTFVDLAQHENNEKDSSADTKFEIEITGFLQLVSGLLFGVIYCASNYFTSKNPFQHQKFFTVLNLSSLMPVIFGVSETFNGRNAF